MSPWRLLRLFLVSLFAMHRLCLLCLILCPVLSWGWTPPQREWLSEHPTLRVGVVLAPPIALEAVDSSKARGLALDYLELLQTELGVTLQPVFVDSQAALDRKGESHEIDMAFAIEQTPEHLRHWLFSEAFLTLPNQLIVSGEKAHAAWPETLNGSLTAVLPQTRVSHFLRRNYPAIRLAEASSASQALKRLQAGEFDVAVLDRAQAQYWLQMPQFAALRSIGEAGYPSLLRIGVRNDWPELAEMLDLALAQLPEAAVAAIEKRWILGEQRAWWDRPLLWGSVALSSLLVAMLFALMALKNRRLSEQTQRQLRQLEEELEARLKLAQALTHTQFSVDQSPIGVLRLGWNGHIQYANLAVCHLLGSESEALLDSPFQDVDPSFDHDNVRWLSFWNGLRRQHIRTYETELRHGTSLVPVEVHACHQSFGEQEYLVLFMTDISERNRIRRALEESEARFRELANHVPGMVFQLRQQFGDVLPVLAYLSEASIELCGYPADYLQTQQGQLQSIVYPADRVAFETSFNTAVQANLAWSWQGRIVTARGEIKWIDLKASRRMEEDGTRIWDGMAWDITANKRIEQSLGESRLLLRELAAHHETLREREKASIAREVHDELGQVLTAMKIETSVCELALIEKQPELAGRMSGLKKLIDQTLQISRNVVTALRPPALDLGLLPALEWLTQRVQERLQLHCELEIAAQVQDIDEARGVILFRIVQEALTNVARHAQASWVLIRIEYREHDLILRIEDDGKGFEPESISRTFGLVGIRERVWMLRGELAIDSAPGAGTRIVVTIPHLGEPYDSRPDR